MILARPTTSSWLPLLLIAATSVLGARHGSGRGSKALPGRVRTTDPRLSTLITEGYRRSSTFRRLVDAIGLTDGIVYIVPGRCPASGLRGCLLHSVHTTQDTRYLRIVIRPGEPRAEAIATIAHELQHAVEVLERQWLRSGADVRQFYATGGAGPSGDFWVSESARKYETATAVRIADAVRAELDEDPAAAIDADDGR